MLILVILTKNPSRNTQWIGYCLDEFSNYYVIWILINRMALSRKVSICRKTYFICNLMGLIFWNTIFVSVFFWFYKIIIIGSKTFCWRNGELVLAVFSIHSPETNSNSSMTSRKSENGIAKQKGHWALVHIGRDISRISASSRYLKLSRNNNSKKAFQKCTFFDPHCRRQILDEIYSYKTSLIH